MSLTWMMTRGSGIVAYALLAAATIWGLLLSTGILGSLAKVKGLTWFHESVGLAALLATGVHLTALGLDGYVDFGPRELFVPGASTWRPLATSLGVMAFYALAIVAVSFYVKRWIGQQRWRALHYLSFGTFAAASAHGLLAGTDRSNPYLLTMYAVAAIAVVALLVVRAAGVAGPSPTAPQQQRSRVGEPV